MFDYGVSHKQLKFSIMSSGKVLLGVLAGVAAGALIGILFAPDKGTETRKKIVKKSEDYVDEVKEKFNGLIDDLTKKMDGVHAKANKMADNAKATVEDAKVSTN
jgi:gas vesicle protein